MIISFITLSRYLLQNNCRTSQLYRNINLPYYVVKHRKEVIVDYKQFSTFKSVLPYFNSMLENTLPNIKKCSLILILAKELKQAPRLIRDNSLCVFKSCVAQFEYVLAYRIRRGQQLISLYTKLWDEMALKRFMQQIRRLAYRRGKEFLFGSATLAFDWKADQISESELKKHLTELELCQALRDKITQGKSGQGANFVDDDDPWSPFIQKNDLIVWKKEEGNRKGLYCYKMYGKYLDVTAKDFLSVFLDIDNRTKWDQHAVQLRLIDSDPATNSDIIYWETKWPKLFSNRDYVFTRRYYVDESAKVMVVMNRSSKHPDYPEVQSKSRVTEYWSCIVIKPTSEFNQPGIEFSLTYFDNPGVSMPAAISLWVSSTGMPEYIKRLRIEALKVSEERTKMEEITESKQPGHDKENIKTREREPPTREGDTEDCSSVNSQSPTSDRAFEPFLLWAYFMDKVGAKA